jgi:ketosteroid isomerase-like protein
VPERILGVRAGGVEALVDYFDPSAELIAPAEWPEARVDWGHNGVRRVWAAWSEQFDDFHTDLARIIDCGGDRVIALMTQRGRIKESERELEQRVAVDFEIQRR